MAFLCLQGSQGFKPQSLPFPACLALGPSATSSPSPTHLKTSQEEERSAHMGLASLVNDAFQILPDPVRLPGLVSWGGRPEPRIGCICLHRCPSALGWGRRFVEQTRASWVPSRLQSFHLKRPTRRHCEG